MKTARPKAVLKTLPALLLCLGSATLWAGTEGSSSTFYGQGAGNGQVSNSGANTFVGAAAGYSNISNENTFLGFEAGYHTADGGANTFLGMQSGYSNTSGALNTFIGAVAGGANTTGSYNTFLGQGTGFSNTTGFENTFVGSGAGSQNTGGYYATYVGSRAGSLNVSGQFNTALGTSAGYSNTSGNFNSFLGAQSGYNNANGSLNVFIGNAAGFNETGSNRLYIDNCMGGAPCTSPLVYGEFDNHLVKFNGVTHVAANGAAKSQMHFSLDNGDYGGFLTSVLQNNFFVSSGARYDSGNWVQRSSDGNAVIAGSGGAGYRIFTNSGNTVGANFTPTLRLQIDYSGDLGLNTPAVAGTPIMHSSGAHLTAGGVWTDASSREYKEHIAQLSTADAMRTFAALTPVTYNYKVDPREKHVGFIAEDVPELIATKDRKSLSPMDIVAVLTKVVQEKSALLDEKSRALEQQKAEVTQMKALLLELASEVRRLQTTSGKAQQ